MIVSEEQVLAEIQRVVERELPSPRSIRAEDRLVDDLGLDSLTMTTLAVELEDHFQIILSDDEASRVETVAELVRCVTVRVRGAS